MISLTLFGSIAIQRSFRNAASNWSGQRLVGSWLVANTTADDVIMAEVLLKSRRHVPVPTTEAAGQNAPLILSALQQENPTVVVTSVGSDWQRVTEDSWFLDNYLVYDQIDNSADESYLFWRRRSSSDRPLHATVAGHFHILDPHLEQTTIQPGDAVTVTLPFRVIAEVDQPFLIEWHLLSPEDNMPIYRSATEFPHETVLSQWLPERTVLEKVTLAVPENLPFGAYQLSLSTRPVDGQESWAIYQNGDTNPIDKVRVDYVTIPWQEPIPPSLPVNAFFGEAITLHSFNLLGTPSPGQAIDVELFWEGDSPADNYAVFLHLFDEQGELAASHDSEPLNGRYPTAAWTSETIVPDTHTLPLELDLEPGTYFLEVGLYETGSGERMPVWDQFGEAQLDHSLPLGIIEIQAE